MKTLTKISLDAMAKLLPELDEDAQRCIVGGTGSCSGVTGCTPTAPTGYTFEQMDSMCTDGSWTGGYVDGYGYYGPVTIVTGFRVTGSYDKVTGAIPPDNEFWANLKNDLFPTDDFEGATIYVDRFQYSDQSTISTFDVRTTDNSVSNMRGYFLEPAWDASKSTVAGSDRAIEPGTYDVSPYSSAKYRDNYILEDVPGRSYVLIHRGNAPENTAGCLLPGTSYSKDWVSGSTTMYNNLNSFLKQYGQDGIRIIIEK